MQDDYPPKPGLLKGIWKILTLRCDEATRLVSDGLDRELHPMERIALRMHLISCRPCKRMRAQFNLLHKAGRRLARSPRPAPSAPQTPRGVQPDEGENGSPE